MFTVDYVSRIYRPFDNFWLGWYYPGTRSIETHNIWSSVFAADKQKRSFSYRYKRYVWLKRYRRMCHGGHLMAVQMHLWVRLCPAMCFSFEAFVLQVLLNKQTHKYNKGHPWQATAWKHMTVHEKLIALSGIFTFFSPKYLHWCCIL